MLELGQTNILLATRCTNKKAVYFIILYFQQLIAVVLYTYSCKPKVLDATGLQNQEKYRGAIKLSTRWRRK